MVLSSADASRNPCDISFAHCRANSRTKLSTTKREPSPGGRDDKGGEPRRIRSYEEAGEFLAKLSLLFYISLMEVDNQETDLSFALNLAIAVIASRKARKWSQANLALKCVLSRKTVIRLEAGYPVSAETIRIICDKLEIEPLDIDEQEAVRRRLHIEADEIRRLRKELGLGLQECAAAAHVSTATFSRWERQLASPATLVTLRPDGTWYANNHGLATMLGMRGLKDLNKAIGGYDEFVPASMDKPPKG